MDFFARQDSSRRTTRRLVVAFAVAFTLVALATTAVAAIAVGVYSQGTVATAAGGGWLGLLERNAVLLAGVAAATLALMVLASLFRAASIARGGGQVARLLGGTEVATATADPLQTRLVNVVEEMAIASGLPVPEIYVLDSEAGINAFAAGLDHSNAAIAVTRGALEQLDRAELQGVIAHELGHVLNGDMRLNQRLMGYSFGILVLTLAGRWMLHSSRFAMRSRNRGMSAVLMIGLALVVIGGIGVLLTRAIKAAVSRERERLADASAVQFTREPAGLAGALKKIGGYTAKLETIESEEVSHMLFGSAPRPFAGWLATHPPLVERIRVLEPEFEGRDYPAPRPPGTAADAAADSAAASAFASTHETPPDADAAPGDDPLARAGTVASAEIGGALRRAIPEPLYAAAHDRDACLLLVIASAVSSETAVAERQGRLVENRLGAARAERCRALRTELDALAPELRLPLVEIAIPAIRQRPREQLEFLADLVAELGALDESPRLFDDLLLLLLKSYLGAAPQRRARRAPRLSERAAVELLYASVAAHGHDDAPTAAAAYGAGLAALGHDAGDDAACFAELKPLRDPARLERALARLTELPARSKRGVLTGLLALIRHDRELRTRELELLRVVGATLGCPLPPSGPRLRVT